MEETVPKNIVYAIASRTWGGGEQYVYNLAFHLKNRYAVCPCFLFLKGSDKAMIQRFALIGHYKIINVNNVFLRFSLIIAREISKILNDFHTDVLHINSRQAYFYAVMAKRFAKKPFRIIATQHLVRSAKNNFFWCWLYKQIDKLVCVSQCVYDTYLQSFTDSMVFPSVCVVHNSIPVSKLERKNRSISKIVKIIYHGRICREKGIDTLFEALSIIQDQPFHITFVGDVSPEDKRWWSQLLFRSPIKNKISVVGFSANVFPLLEQNHIGVLPSIVREAGGPLALIEDMAVGLAVIATNNGSQSEFINDGINGMLISPGDPQVLATVLTKLINNRELISHLGEKAQEDFFALHSYNTFAEKMFNLYCE